MIVKASVHYLTIIYMIIQSYLPRWSQEFQLEYHDKLMDNMEAYQIIIFFYSYYFLKEIFVLCVTFNILQLTNFLSLFQPYFKIYN